MPTLQLTNRLLRAIQASFALLAVLPRTCSLCALGKKQGAASHSPAESETVAGDLGPGLRRYREWPYSMQCWKDKSAVCFLKTIKPLWESSPLGKQQALRHVLKTHRSHVHLVTQVCREQPDLGACESNLMAGDLFTKCFSNSKKWYEVMKQIAHALVGHSQTFQPK